MKYLILNNKENLSEIVDFLIEETGLPQIRKKLNIYSEDSDIQIEMLDNKIYFGDSSRKKYNFIRNKNLKQFFKYINSKNKNGFIINDIILLKFPNINLMFDTFHGNILSSENEELIKKIKDKFGLEVYDNINEHTPLFAIKPENLFDEIGNINLKIKNYANETGLDIRSTSASIKLRLSNVSNDYTFIEKFYKLITKNDLLSFDTEKTYMHKFKNISIIIPTFNTNVVSTLLSIQGQNLSKENKEKIQVIVIDDGSSFQVIDDINKIRNKLDYELNVVTFDKNMGISNARNAGLSISKYDLLLFMDSDIILSNNYLYDINMRLQVIPNAMFVAMRKNVEKTSELLTEKNILSGIERTLDFDDSRVVTKSKEYHIGWDKIYNDEIISVLDDTNYFKELSYGSKVGIYDLSSVATGHNIAINRDKIAKYPAFSNRFSGWGMEDSYFASSLIANGCFVIPLLSSCVYHIAHPPRSGSMEQKSKEAKLNYDTHNSMLDEKWDE